MKTQAEIVNIRFAKADRSKNNTYLEGLEPREKVPQDLPAKEADITVESTTLKQSVNMQVVLFITCRANSFILMFFTEDMNDCMTLAHELGHAGHFQLYFKIY